MDKLKELMKETLHKFSDKDKIVFQKLRDILLKIQDSKEKIEDLKLDKQEA